MEWILQRPAVPPVEGWYRVMHPGDWETIDGMYKVYDFPDYEAWAYWCPAAEEEFEDFDGGFKGDWRCSYDEDGDGIFAYYGPIEFPPFRAA